MESFPISAPTAAAPAAAAPAAAAPAAAAIADEWNVKDRPYKAQS